MHGITASLHGRTLYPKIDLVRVSHLIPAVIKDIGRTVIAMPFGLFYFLSITLGCVTLTKHFRGLWWKSHKTWILFVPLWTIHKWHHQMLTNVFKSNWCLPDNRVAASPDAYELDKTELTFLGREITQELTETSKDELRTLLYYAMPFSRKDLKAVPRIVNLDLQFTPTKLNACFHQPICFVVIHVR